MCIQVYVSKIAIADQQLQPNNLGEGFPWCWIAYECSDADYVKK